MITLKSLTFMVVLVGGCIAGAAYSQSRGNERPRTALDDARRAAFEKWSAEQNAAWAAGHHPVAEPLPEASADDCAPGWEWDAEGEACFVEVFVDVPCEAVGSVASHEIRVMATVSPGGRAVVTTEAGRAALDEITQDSDLWPACHPNDEAP